MSQIELYAELLTNIRTVTLVASLRTATNKETRIELAGDGQTITISHEGISASLRLPTRMIGGGTAALTLPPRPSKDLTLRLRVEETAPGLLTFEHNEENLVPWPASAMEDARSVRCFRCGTCLVEGEVVAEWRDLPNENWAEMMDFWHCHKPHEHEHGEHGGGDGAVDRKGYSAANKLAAKTGMGYVGLSYFVFASEDCENVKVSLRYSPSLFFCFLAGFYKLALRVRKERCTSSRKALLRREHLIHTSKRNLRGVITDTGCTCHYLGDVLGLLSCSGLVSLFHWLMVKYSALMPGYC
jgi:hypothetical protein